MNNIFVFKMYSKLYILKLVFTLPLKLFTFHMCDSRECVNNSNLRSSHNLQTEKWMV